MLPVKIKVKVTTKVASAGRAGREKKMAKDKSIPMEIDEVPAKAVKRGKAAVNKETSQQAEVAKEENVRPEKRRKTAGKLAEIAKEEVNEESMVIDEVSEDENVLSDTNNNKKSVAKKIKHSGLVVQPKQDRGVGKPLVCGTNDVGQLGFTAQRRKHPATIPFFEEKNLVAQEVVAGGMHTVVLTSEGHVYCFGCNDDLALGRVTEDEDENFVPTRINIPGTVVQISAGDSHSAALTDDGVVYAWGQFRDQNGSIGLTSADKNPQPIPQCLSKDLLTKVIKIASGAHHLVMLGQEGMVYTCGSGEQGQLGRIFSSGSTRSTRSKSSVPKDAREFWLTPAPITLKSRVKFVDVFAGSFSTYCKSMQKGEIFVCGLNNFNQLGIQRRGNEEAHLVVTTVTRSPGFKGCQWKEIAAGEHHCVALSNDGKVYSLGRQEDGRLGLGDGVGDVSLPTLIPGLKDHNCVHVACGLSQGYAVTDKGALFSWGFGENCQLGNGNDEDSTVPTQCPGSAILLLDNCKIIYVSGGGQHAAMIGIFKTVTNGKVKDANVETKAKAGKVKK